MEVKEGGKGGRLIHILRTTNTIDDVSVGEIAKGHPYAGADRSDIHDAIHSCCQILSLSDS